MGNGSISTLNCLLRMGANPYHNNIKSFTYVSKKEFDIKQAFFMELVRVMNIGYIDRIIDILNCGYIPDNSIIDWIPEDSNGLEDKIMNLFYDYNVIPKKEKDIEEENENDDDDDNKS